MDKNTITGFVLIAIVLIGFSWYSKPSAEQQRAAFVQDSIRKVEQQKADAMKKQAAQKAAEEKAKQEADTSALFHAAMQTSAATPVVLKNDKVELTFSTKGGTVQKAVIKGYKDRNGKADVTLFDGKEQQLNFMLATKEANIATQDLNFKIEEASDTAVTFVADAGNDRHIAMHYHLAEDYLLRMALQVHGMQGLFAPNYSQIDVDWKGKLRQQERGFTFENRYATLTYKEKDGSTDYLSETKEEVDKPIEEALDWVAFKDQFFSAIMIAKNGFSGNGLFTSIPQEKGSGYLKQYQAKLKTAFDPTGKEMTEMEFYFGPNDFRILQSASKSTAFGKDLELKKLVYLGWPVVRWINRFFTIYVFDWLSKVFPMGVVLILITLLLKAITYPLVKKSYMSSAKMRVLKPKLEEATKQYNNPEDQMQKQQAMMQEYAKYGVSPLSGCLPMLIQMPIWIAMFNFVPNAIQLRGEKFLWIDDLSTYDPIVEWGTHIWGIGDHLSLTCILFCVSNVLYSWMTMRQQRDQMVGQQAEQMKMMQWMMYLMPLMFFFMFNDYSSGLNFYYFVSLFMSATIMFILRKTTNDEKLLAILEARYKENKNNPQKASGLAARLQAMQEQQQEMLRKRQELERKKNQLNKK